MTPLSARAKQILYAAVSEFVQTGEPVGSRTLSKRGIDLSPASIRNVLADLEEAGYLVQPHTSAGRVPTDLAFRLFIDALMEVRELTREEHEMIRARFEEMAPGTAGLRETGKLLSDLTGAAAVVVAPRGQGVRLKHMRFIRTLPGEVLAVLVMADGTVQNRFLQFTITEPELERVHNLLDDVIDGRTLADLREFFERRRHAESTQNDSLRRTAFEMGGAAVSQLTTRADADLVIEGRVKLLERPDFAQAHDLKNIVSALDDEEHIVRLLDATLEAKGTAVLVGREAGDLGNGQLAVVSASYSKNGQSQGAIGVIGPTRMDYAKVVPLVTATASAMTELLDRDGRDAGESREARERAQRDGREGRDD
jgi:heat-inducible transcriptional repressor